VAKKTDLSMRKTVLSTGLVFAALYLLWALVMAGAGMMGYWGGMPMMGFSSYAYPGFSFVMLVYGAVSSFIVGAIVGGLFALVWNGLSD